MLQATEHDARAVLRAAWEEMIALNQPKLGLSLREIAGGNGLVPVDLDLQVPTLSRGSGQDLDVLGEELHRQATDALRTGQRSSERSALGQCLLVGCSDPHPEAAELVKGHA